MPLYEYQCDSCGTRFERIQKFSDPLVTVCPACGGTVRKLLSSPAIQFKGSGFYITDYPKSAAPSPGASPDSAAKPSSEKSSEDKSSPAESKTSSAEPAKADAPAKTESPAPKKTTSAD